jgi:hypothetical protein
MCSRGISRPSRHLKQVLARLSGRYSLAVHPCITGTPVGEDGEFARAGDRRAVLDLLVQLHCAEAVRPRAEDFVVPHLDALGPMMGEPREAWQGGPCARRAGELLQARAAGLGVLVSAYAGLARRVAQRRDRMVITHGEPHAGNVMTAPGGLVLVDWDTVLLAQPERDLWDMAGDDRSLLEHYTRATGVPASGRMVTSPAWPRSSHGRLKPSASWRQPKRLATANSARWRLPARVLLGRGCTRQATVRRDAGSAGGSPMPQRSRGTPWYAVVRWGMLG